MRFFEEPRKGIEQGARFLKDGQLYLHRGFRSRSRSDGDF